HELVRVDSRPARAAGVVVVLDQVLTDQHLASAGVGEPDAGDVVLDDVVEDLGAGGPLHHVEAVGEDRVGSALEGEAVDDDVVSADDRAPGVRDVRLRPDPGPGIDAVLRPAQGQGLVDVQGARTFGVGARGHADDVPRGRLVDGKLDGLAGRHARAAAGCVDAGRVVDETRGSGARRG